MSILIRDMTMPTSCMLCSFCVEEADPANGEMCMVTGTLMPPCTRVRLDDCPLVPVPPHGRLIDADAVQEQWYQLNFDHKLTDGTLAYWNFVLSKAPTVIEAEREEK